MAYSSELRDTRIGILQRTSAEMGDFGLDTNGAGWKNVGSVWASVTWAKGNRALNAGSVDAYAVVNVRMLWTNAINARCRIVHEGEVYQILPETFHADRRKNEVQFLAQGVVKEG